MFEKVLIPTDFSKYAEKLIDCIGDVPGVKEVVLLNVVTRDPLARAWSPGDEVKEAEKKLTDARKRLEDMGLKAKVRVEPALDVEVDETVRRIADEEGVSLIAMGAKGRGILEGVLLGSVSTGVLRYAIKDLLIMRYKSLGAMKDEAFEKFCTRAFSKILCPIDFSDAGMSAVNAIKAGKMADEVVLVHVITRAESVDQLEAAMNEAEKRLYVIRDDLAAAGIRATVQVLKAGSGHARTYGTGGMVEVRSSAVAGGAAEKIIDASEKEDVSMIAMSSHGKGWIDQITIGSVVFDVARMARRPVLVIRSRKMA